MEWNELDWIELGWIGLGIVVAVFCGFWFGKPQLSTSDSHHQYHHPYHHRLRHCITVYRKSSQLLCSSISMRHLFAKPARRGGTHDDDGVGGRASESRNSRIIVSSLLFYFLFFPFLPFSSTLVRILFSTRAIET